MMCVMAELDPAELSRMRDAVWRGAMEYNKWLKIDGAILLCHGPRHGRRGHSLHLRE